MNARQMALHFAIGGVMTLACAGGISAQDSMPRTGQMGKGRYESLEAAASKATGEDRNSVAALADEVFKVPHYGNYMPAAFQNSIKNHLIDAEVGHRQGVRPGIDEEAIVQAFNAIADRLTLPEYAKTNVSQVRYLRMRAALASPIFMGSGMTRPGVKIGDQINTTMSPAQAVHLIQVLADQKYSNPSYQVSPADWDPMNVHPSFRDSGSPLQVSQNPKRDEMRSLISKAGSGLTFADAEDLINQTLKTLGM